MRILVLGWAIIGFASAGLVAESPPSASRKREESAARKVVSFGGRADKSEDGTVHAVTMVEKVDGIITALNDDDIRMIDFGAFSKLAHLTVIATQATDRSILEFEKDFRRS